MGGGTGISCSAMDLTAMKVEGKSLSRNEDALALMPRHVPDALRSAPIRHGHRQCGRSSNTVKKSPSKIRR
jgi:hypothetical protein